MNNNAIIEKDLKRSQRRIENKYEGKTYEHELVIDDNTPETLVTLFAEINLTIDTAEQVYSDLIKKGLIKSQWIKIKFSYIGVEMHSAQWEIDYNII